MQDSAKRMNSVIRIRIDKRDTDWETPSNEDYEVSKMRLEEDGGHLVGELIV